MEVTPIFWIVFTLKAPCELTWFGLIFCDKRQQINLPWGTKKIQGTCHKTTVWAFGWGGCYWKGYITRLTWGQRSFFRWGQANSRAVGGNSCLRVFFLPALTLHPLFKHAHYQNINCPLHLFQECYKAMQASLQLCATGDGYIYMLMCAGSGSPNDLYNSKTWVTLCLWDSPPKKTYWVSKLLAAIGVSVWMAKL